MVKYSLKQWLQTFATGLCVGAADIVPGISGGTVAFLMGVYEKLLKSIMTVNVRSCILLFKGKFHQFFQAVSWRFLLAFVLGAASSLIVFAKFFAFLLNHEIWRMYLYAAFTGLVAGSCLFCFRVLGKIRFIDACLFFVGCQVAYILSCTHFTTPPEGIYSVPLNLHRLPSAVVAKLATTECINVDKETGYITDVPREAISILIAKKALLPDQYIYDNINQKYILAETVTAGEPAAFIDMWVVACGVMAISAMLLPGISGSYVLNVLGMYGVILCALVDWVEGIKQGIFDMPAFRIVFSMVLGVTLGLFLFSRIIAWLLDHYRQPTVACLIGFMVGALRAVWPFWTYTHVVDPFHIQDGPKLVLCDPVLPSLFSPQCFIACVVTLTGIIAVLAIESSAKKRRSMQLQQEKYVA